MIYVGIDDTDTLDSRGTNQLAKAMARQVADRYACRRIVRHQLLMDPRVPCTSKNGSASLVFEYRRAGRGEPPLPEFADLLRQIMRADFIPGSDPGLCIAGDADGKGIDMKIIDFAGRCQRELVDQQEARQLAAAHGIFLEGLGGTEDGVIGALAAVGLAAANDGGRVVQWEHWPDDLSGVQPLATLDERRIEVRQLESNEPLRQGWIDVGKHLRPNWRRGSCVLFVTRDDSQEADQNRWQAVRLL